MPAGMDRPIVLAKTKIHPDGQTSAQTTTIKKIEKAGGEKKTGRP